MRRLSDDVRARVEALQTAYLDQGVTFDIGGEERAFPLDIVPRVIEMETWQDLDAGVQQRVRALEAFLADVYDGDRWVVVATGRDYLDVRPLQGIFSGAGTSLMFVRVDVTRIA